MYVHPACGGCDSRRAVSVRFGVSYGWVPYSIALHTCNHCGESVLETDVAPRARPRVGSARAGTFTLPRLHWRTPSNGPTEATGRSLSISVSVTLEKAFNRSSLANGNSLGRPSLRRTVQRGRVVTVYWCCANWSCSASLRSRSQIVNRVGRFAPEYQTLAASRACGRSVIRSVVTRSRSRTSRKTRAIVSSRP